MVVDGSELFRMFMFMMFSIAFCVLGYVVEGLVNGRKFSEKRKKWIRGITFILVLISIFLLSYEIYGTF